MPLTLRDDNYPPPPPETSCEHGYTVHNGYIHCNHSTNIFFDSAIGITIITLIICAILFAIKLIAKSKYGKIIFPPFPHQLTEHFSSLRSNPSNTNIHILLTDENGEVIIDDSADPEIVPKYTTNVDPNQDFGFYDNNGNFVLVPKPQPSHLTTFPYTPEYNLSSSPQYSKNPPPYLPHPPQYLGNTLIS